MCSVVLFCCVGLEEIEGYRVVLLVVMKQESVFLCVVWKGVSCVLLLLCCVGSEERQRAI